MRTTSLFISTLKESPHDAELISHRLMLRAGLIRKLSSGLYTWLPLGLKVLRKVEAIVRAELNAIGAQEILMPAVQPAELWLETERWAEFGPQLLKMKDRHQRDFCFGPTHEEVITDLMRRELQSHKQLPLLFYQIQTKFRDEIRPRFGVMRAREFLMKDAYSFHLDAQSLAHTYAHLYQVYTRIFTRLDLTFRAVLADTGSIGGSVSHEFHVLAQSGEDLIAYSDEGDYAANIEMATADHPLQIGDVSPDGRGVLQHARGIEVGHIFQLGDKYSRAMDATVLDAQGNAVPLIMGCYGIGISRIVAAAIEQHHDAQGICWPEPLAPFSVILIPIRLHQSVAVREMAEQIYDTLRAAGIEVLLEDREERPGVLFAQADLLGIPHRVVLSEKGLALGQLEYKARGAQTAKILSLEDLMRVLRPMTS